MLKSVILNPVLLLLLGRVRDTNTLLIPDRGFPSWRQVETVDLSIVDNILKVLEVLRAIQAIVVDGRAYTEQEFETHNTERTGAQFAEAFGSGPSIFEPHAEFKHRVLLAIGLIRSGETTQCANMVIKSA